MPTTDQRLQRLEYLLEEFLESNGTPIAPSIDLSELLIALRELPPPPSAEDIAQALASRLVFPQPTDVTPLLNKVAETLARVDKRRGDVPNMMFGNGVTIKNKTDNPVPVTFDAAEILTTSVQTRETRLEYTGTETNPTYVGEAAPGTAISAASWTVKKLTFDASNRTTRIQVQTDIAWDNRAVGW